MTSVKIDRPYWFLRYIKIHLHGKEVTISETSNTNISKNLYIATLKEELKSRVEEKPEIENPEVSLSTIFLAYFDFKYSNARNENKNFCKQ